MKRSLRLLSFALIPVFLGHTSLKAQNYIVRGDTPIDSVTITFEDSSSLSASSITNARITVDTSGAHLWRIGKTLKPFFSIGDTTAALMTDTTNPYPLNANDWFVLRIRQGYYNPIIYFKHKYQTTAGHDGGIVEFSYDEGQTWDNVKGICNHDSQGSYGLLTDNLYSTTDTLQSGEMAFSGTSNGWQYSGVEFLHAIPIANKSTASCNPMDSIILLRFRFESDSTADTLDGWIIDDIEMKIDHFAGKVNNIAAVQRLNVSPNPIRNGIVNFPALENEKGLQLTIYNAMGSAVLETNYKQQVDLGKYPAGLYFYKVTGGKEYYSGRLIVE